MCCNEETIFEAALQYQNHEERRAYVIRACGTDVKLRAGVEMLLQAHGSQSLLDEPVLQRRVLYDAPVLAEGPGTVIGRYKLLERIGEGGMAVVYVAEQNEPIRRKVALKIIKLGMDTRQVIARCEAERQALALMDHPSIARVLDAGATETGRPYFIMGLIQGAPILQRGLRANGVYAAGPAVVAVACCATAWTKANISSGPCVMRSSMGTST